MARRFAFVIICVWFVWITSGCSPSSDKVVPLPDYSKHADKQQDLGEYVPFSLAADILFLIDDSGSMDVHQQNLAQNISYFVDELKNNQLLDYNIGVVTTTYYPIYNGPQGGQLRGNPTVVSRRTPNFEMALKNNLMVGTNGSGTEIFFDVVSKALSPAFLTGVNAGFYRPDGLFALIMITDTDDQGTLTGDDLYKELLQMKNGKANKITTYGVILPPNETRCQSAGELPPLKLRKFLQLTNGQEFNLCDTDFGKHLAKIGSDILNKIDRVVRLKKLPVVDSIKLTYGSQEIPNNADIGWVYDPQRNAIIFGKNMTLKPEPPGTQMQIYFIPAEI